MTKNLTYTLFWLLIIAINVYFVYNFPLTHFNSQSFNEPFGHLLTVHIVFGTIAILIGPFQFFPGIRKKYTNIHRFTGRVYLISVLVGSIAGFMLAIEDNLLTKHEIIFGTGMLGLASAWLLTSAMAFWAVKNRNFTQHREWMVKSYVVTCGFTTFRVIVITLHDSILKDVDQSQLSDIMAWACWSVPLLVTEVLLQSKKIGRSGRVTKEII